MHRKSQLFIVLLLIFSVALLIVDTGIHFKSKLVKIRNIVNMSIISTPIEKNDVPQMATINISTNKEHNTVVPINRKRYKKMVKFFRDYKDTCKQANVALLGDMIHETLKNHMSALVLPFDINKYCNEFATTRWCHLMNFDLFIFPAIVEYEKYNAQLTDTQYRFLKKRIFFSMKGSDNVMMHVSIPDQNINDQTFYLYGYQNEIFIIPNSYSVQ